MKKMKKGQISHEEREKFEYFIFEMDDVLEKFISDAKKEGMNLDYSLSSLDQLELIILRNLDTETNIEVLKNRAARYIGEVVRKNLGGNWELCDKDPRYLYFKLPVISGYSDIDIEFCPIEIIRNYMRSKKMGMLKKNVEADMEYKKEPKC